MESLPAFPQDLPDPRPMHPDLIRDLAVAPAQCPQLHNHTPLFGLVGVFLVASCLHRKIELNCMPSGRVTCPRNVSRIRDKNTLLYVTIIDTILLGGVRNSFKVGLCCD